MDKRVFTKLFEIGCSSHGVWGFFMALSRYVYGRCVACRLPTAAKTYLGLEAKKGVGWHPDIPGCNFAGIIAVIC